MDNKGILRKSKRGQHELREQTKEKRAKRRKRASHAKVGKGNEKLCSEQWDREPPGWGFRP